MSMSQKKGGIAINQAKMSYKGQRRTFKYDEGISPSDDTTVFIYMQLVIQLQKI